MATVEELPFFPVHAVDPPESEGVACNKRELMSALFALANNNPQFQRGALDKVSFNLDEFDRVVDHEEPGPTESLTYSYTAERLRSPGERPTVGFVFSVTSRLANIPLPAYIAAGVFKLHQGYGALPIARAAEVLGDGFSHEIKHEFDIDNWKWKLHAKEIHSYLDEDGSILHQVSTARDKDDGLVYSAYNAETGSFTEVPAQYPTPGFSERILHDAERLDLSTLQSEEELRAFWGSYVSFEYAVGRHMETQERQQVELSYAVLVQIRRALLVQAGVHKIGGMALLDALT